MPATLSLLVSHLVIIELITSVCGFLLQTRDRIPNQGFLFNEYNLLINTKCW